MNEGINLLEPNKNSGSAISLRRIRKMRVLTIGLLFIISVSSVILFILVALSPLPALQRQEQFLRQTLSASKTSIVKLSLVNSQTDAVNRLLTQRKSFDKPIGLIQDKLSDDITVEQLQVDNDSMVITVESASLQSLDTFLNGLINYVHDKNTFSKATLVDLTTDQATNAYSVTIQLNYL
jgi:hypothetical protein